MSPRLIIYIISRIRDEFHRHLNLELKEKGLSPLTTTHADILFALVKRKSADAGNCQDDQSRQVYVNRSCR